MVPAGFERLLLGHAVAIARSDLAPAVRQMLVSADGTRCTLHEYAERHPSARALTGRGAAYAVPMPGARRERIVVRHNRHGGLFAPLTRDVFLAPTRAPYELEVSRSLARLGIPTPEIVAFALYPPGGIAQRADVCSLEIANAHDLADVVLRGHEAARTAALRAAAELVVSLSRAGARHHDLNAKNVLIADTAYVLDVDRVVLGAEPGAALTANLARLTRSLRKWRDRFGARLSDADILELNRLVTSTGHR
ncbi:MAG TPA: lipopolysaccharide kinase InaA family protein [Gemmatimonadaceae bacterium]|nr:lipopolysaccharide kinase InaA family protein [Gemmatimonadaceae bacterium]